MILYVLIIANLKFGYSRKKVFCSVLELSDYFKRNGYDNDFIKVLFDSGENNTKALDGAPHVDFHLIKSSDFN